MSETDKLQTNVIQFLRKRDYVLIRELGSGACGKTVLLHDDQIDEHFVCKKYEPYAESARQALFDNFVREIKLLHKLHHRNLLRIFNYYLYPDQQVGYILMEFVDGLEIDSYTKIHPDKVAELFVQAVDGFAYLETCGILHRDIRPANMMVTNDGVLKIIDLGFGKEVKAGSDFGKSITLNWAYSQPEEFSASIYNFCTEVYFVGKLFQSLINENNIKDFKYKDVVRDMCEPNPKSRLDSFRTVNQIVGSSQFYETEFTKAEIAAYRNFADDVCGVISKIHGSPRYNSDPQLIEQSLSARYSTFSLEENVPTPVAIVQCFLLNEFYYQQRAKVSVKVVKTFLAMFRNCSSQKKKVLLANLQARLDAIPRYEKSEVQDDDIPF